MTTRAPWRRFQGECGIIYLIRKAEVDGPNGLSWEARLIRALSFPPMYANLHSTCAHASNRP
jgi:hypothetical protein